MLNTKTLRVESDRLAACVACNPDSAKIILYVNVLVCTEGLFLSVGKFNQMHASPAALFYNIHFPLLVHSKTRRLLRWDDMGPAVSKHKRLAPATLGQRID